MDASIQTGLALLTAVGLKVLGAIVIWFVGCGLIRFFLKMMGRALDRQNLDRTARKRFQSPIHALK
jgi:hypothetical protein